MTNEEAIEYLKWARPIKPYSLDKKRVQEAIDMAIKALEQKLILDKIRAEIEHIIDYTYDSTDYDKSLYNGAYKDGLYEALDVIDKYKTESEEKDTDQKSLEEWTAGEEYRWESEEEE